MLNTDQRREIVRLRGEGRSGGGDRGRVRSVAADGVPGPDGEVQGGAMCVTDRG